MSGRVAPIFVRSARARSATFVASILLAPALAAAQPASSGETPKPPVQPAPPASAPASAPPGMVPAFPPGAAPGAPPAQAPPSTRVQQPSPGMGPAPIPVTPPSAAPRPAPPAAAPPAAAPPAAPPGGAPQPGAYPAPGYGGYPAPGYGGYPAPGYGAPGGYYPPPYTYPYPAGMGLLPPATLPYEEGQTVPHGYRIKSRPVRALVIAGSVTFGGAYLTSLLTAATVLSGGSSEGKQLAPLFAPVVGPFVAIGTTGSSGAGTLWLVLDGLAQTGGAVMLIYGLAAEEKFLQRAATGQASPVEVLTHPEIFVGGRSAALRWTL